MSVISQDYMNHTAKQAMPERRHLVKIEPTSTNPSDSAPVNAGSTIEFLNLPTASAAVGSYIATDESYMTLKVRCKVKATETARLNRAGAAGLFSRIQVNSSGYVVEDSNHHNQLISLLADMTTQDRDPAGVKSKLEGLGDGKTGVLSIPQPGQGAAAVNVPTPSSTNIYEKGALYAAGNLAAGGAADVRTETKTFILPLQGQFWNSVKMLPVHMISDLAYRLTLEQDLAGVVSPKADDDAEGYEVVGIALHMCYVEVSPSSRSMLNSRAGSSWSSPCWSVTRDNLDKVGAKTLKIPEAKSSVKTMAISFRKNDAATSKKLDEDALSRKDPNLRSYQFNVNGVLQPANPVDSKEQMLVQAMRAFHNPHGYNMRIKPEQWGNPGTDNGKVADDKFFIAESFESKVGNKGFSGVSTLAQHPMVVCTFDDGDATESNVFYYVQYDCRYAIENGIIRVSY